MCHDVSIFWIRCSWSAPVHIALRCWGRKCNNTCRTARAPRKVARVPDLSRPNKRWLTVFHYFPRWWHRFHWGIIETAVLMWCIGPQDTSLSRFSQLTEASCQAACSCPKWFWVVMVSFKLLTCWLWFDFDWGPLTFGSSDGEAVRERNSDMVILDHFELETSFTSCILDGKAPAAPFLSWNSLHFFKNCVSFSTSAWKLPNQCEQWRRSQAEQILTLALALLHEQRHSWVGLDGKDENHLPSIEFGEPGTSQIPLLAPWFIFERVCLSYRQPSHQSKRHSCHEDRGASP